MPKPLFGSRKPVVRVISKRVERESPRLRGYDSRWDRLSAEIRRRAPFCGWCEQEGRLRMCELVDHKIPVADGGPIYERSNLWSLCKPCHGRKAEMEEHARREGVIQSLLIWCDDPERRPDRFKSAG